MSALLSLAVYLFAVVLLIGLLMAVTHLTGQRHFESGTGIPYESGIPPTGSARLRFSADFRRLSNNFETASYELSVACPLASAKIAR